VNLDAKFRSLRDMLLEGTAAPAVRTDNSILVVYPPEEEHDFRDQLRRLLGLLEARRVPYRHLDLATLPFEALEAAGVLEETLEQECEDLRPVKRGLAGLVQEALETRIGAEGASAPNGIVLLSGSAALYPVIKFADVLAGLRHLPCRIVLAFPGQERDGKLYFMNQRDGYNYLAVKLT
jgi:hypothetical protein